VDESTRFPFIWGGKETPTRAKVRWETLALPIAHGGLGVTDPKSQLEALLVKLLVRRLAPGGEPWKELVWHKAGQTRLPLHGKGPSIPDLNWLLGGLASETLGKRVSPRGGTMEGTGLAQSRPDETPSPWQGTLHLGSELAPRGP
jgi:hypothetical protein